MLRNVLVVTAPNYERVVATLRRVEKEGRAGMDGKRNPVVLLPLDVFDEVGDVLLAIDEGIELPNPEVLTVHLGHVPKMNEDEARCGACGRVFNKPALINGFCRACTLP